MCENHTAQDCLDTLNRLQYLTDEEVYQKQQLERIIERERGDSELNRRTVCGAGRKSYRATGIEEESKGASVNPIRVKKCSRAGVNGCSCHQS